MGGLSNFCPVCGTKILDPVFMIIKLLYDLRDKKLRFVCMNQTKGVRGFRVFKSGSKIQGKFVYENLVTELVKTGKPGVLMLNYKHDTRGPDSHLFFLRSPLHVPAHTRQPAAHHNSPYLLLSVSFFDAPLRRNSIA